MKPGRSWPRFKGISHFRGEMHRWSPPRCTVGAGAGTRIRDATRVARCASVSRGQACDGCRCRTPTPSASKQGHADVLARDHGPFADRAALDQLDKVIQQVPAVQDRNRSRLRIARLSDTNREELQEPCQPHSGRRLGHLGDADDAGHVAGRGLPVSILPNMLKVCGGAAARWYRTTHQCPERPVVLDGRFGRRSLADADHPAVGFAIPATPCGQ